MLLDIADRARLMPRMPMLLRDSVAPNRKLFLPWLVAALAVTAFNFDDLLTGDRVPVYRDILQIVMPMHHYLGDHLRRGEFPLWNPLTFMGTPFLANWQSAVFYPPSLL